MNKKKYLLGLIIILFIASVTSALGAVTITPSSPTAADDLTCLVNGAICNSAGLCTPHWTGNSFSGEKFFNPLPHKFISAGDKVKCEAWASAPMGDYLIGSASVTISTPPVNTPPNIFGRIPDYNILRNSGLNDDLVPLWNFASDAETPTNRLIFTITRQTNTPIVNCVIDNQTNRIVNPGVFVDCTAQLNQVGYSDITVRVMDAGGLWTEDIFRVSVIGAGNTPPTLIFLPDVTIAEDSGLNMNLIDLWNYAYDAETSDDQLIFTITSETGLTITDCSIRNNRYIECLTLLNQNGISDVTVMVQDQGGLVASDTFRVTVTPVNDAPVVNNIPDVTMYEDLPNSADPQIDLDNFANDPDGDIISWTAASSTINLAVIINPDNTVTFNPILNWFGTAVVTFTATDSGGLTGSDSINVIVYPVNDIPVISGIPNQTFLEDFGFANNAINLWNYASDIETPTNQLTFSVLSQSAPGIVDCVLDSNRYIDCTSQQDQNGFSDVVVQVSDSQGGTDTAAFRISVTPVNDAPTINPLIPDQTRDEDSNPWSLDLTNYGHDAEDAQTALRWSVAGVNAALFSTSFDANNRIITFTPVANACGSDVITLTVTDLQGLAVSQDITLTLTCVNDLPWINPIILDQTRDEDSLPWSLDLTSYGNDIETAQANLIWSASGVDTNLFNILFDANNRIITFIPVANAFGTDVITLTVTDSDGASVSQNIRITLSPVNDIPYINPVIPDQTRDEGSLPWGLDLSLYEHDVEDSSADLTWGVSGVDTSLLSVSVDPVTHIATFILANADVFGSDTITFTLTDSEGASVSQNVLVTINSINDAPVVSDIPDITFNEDTITTINLDTYVSDVDNANAQLIWSFSGNTNIIVNINPATHVATLSAPADWNGQESITFRATDPGGLYDEDSLIINVIAVNDAPVVSPFAVLTMNEDSTDSINLNNYVSDVDNLDSEIIWSYTGNSYINVIITPEKIAVFVPAANWVGSETITFTASDPGGLSDSEPLSVVVNAVNDAPIVSDIPNINFNEDGSYTTSWNLSDYVSDIDNTDIQISWSFSGNTNVNVLINPDRTITFSTIPDWNGAEIIIFRATDPGGAYDEDTVTVSVNPMNDAPVVSNIPDVIIPEDGVDFSIDLDNYVSDVDNLDSEMSWSYSGNINIIVNIDPASHIVVLTPLPNWNGQETIIFRACDPNLLCNSDSSLVSIGSVNDAPVVSDIPNINFNEDGNFVLNLSDYVSDVDNLDLQIDWSVSGNIDINIVISNGIATITAPADWNGFESVTFTATDLGGLSDSDSSIILVNAINDIPYINPVIPDQVRNENNPPWSLDLTGYGNDVENAQTSLVWSVAGVDTALFTTSFDINQRIITFSSVTEACGSDTITLTVTDLEGASASQDIDVILNCINGAPVVSNIPNIQISEDSLPVTLIDLDGFVSDVDNMDSEITWTYSPAPANIGININPTTHEVTFTILTPNWYGPETITFRATDPGGAYDEDDVTIIVLPVNDLPVITISSPASPVDINEGSSQLFSVTAIDIDGPNPLSYYWQLDGINITGATLSWYTYTATNGPASHTLRAVVSDGIATVSQLWNINEINVPPQGVSAGGPYYCAAGNTVILTGTATDPVDTLIYSWDFDNDGAYDDSTGQSPSFLCATSEIFNIGLSVSDGTDSVTATTTITVYNLVINEIMQNPNIVLDTTGEWFELYNAGTFAVDLNGWRISDLGTNTHTISGSLVIPVGDYLVLCINGDPLINGGVNCDYDYANFDLGNADDEIILTTNLGLEVDSVVYDGGPNFPDPTGATMELINPSLNNNLGANWQTATIPYGLGDLGTPGSANGGIVIIECNDGLDNDGDGEIDLADYGCVNILDNSEVGITQCGDGIDNDADIFIDQNDPDCIGPLDNDESVVINNPPVANAGSDQAITTGSLVTLDGSGSSDPDGDPITYLWTQISGTAVVLSDNTIVNPTFTPSVDGSYVFQLIVNDGTVNSAADFVTIVATTIPPTNNPPIANADIDQIINIGSLVTLNGAGSSDPDGDPITYLWTQISGPSITLNNPTTTNPSFTPSVTGSYVFMLTVEDTGSLTDSDFVTITVNPAAGNNPPTITSIDVIPTSVGLDGTLACVVNSFDPDGDPVTISYVWSTTGAYDLSGFTTSILDLSMVAGESDGDVITCTATPNDGTINGASDFDTSTITVAPPPPNNPPIVTILSPASGSAFNQGDMVSFTGAGFDSEDGDLTSSIQWSSNIDGLIGIGGVVNTNSLSLGAHTINLSVCDSGSLCDSNIIAININPAASNTAPVITGIPDRNLASGSGLNNNIIDLWNYAVDAETIDSALTYIIISETNTALVDCSVDTNRYIDCTASAGMGFSDVTVQVQDPEGLTDTDIFRVNIIGGNLNPNVIITNPSTGSTFTSGTSINFVGTATDPEDGDISSNIAWSSSLDGPLGNGASLIISSLSVGTHTIGAQITDSGGASDSDEIIITISPLTGQTIINSFINSNSYPLNFPADVAGAGDGNVAGSSIIDSTINGIANAINSYIYNSVIAAGSIINNCVILSSAFGGTCTDSIIDPSNIVNSVIDAESDIEDSTIINSTIINSNITDSNIIGFVIENANVNNNQICNGKINGYTVTSCHDIYEYKNSAPNAVINANPVLGIDSLAVSFSAAGSTDPNVGGVLGDSLTYSWNFGDSGTATGLTATHTYNIGTYTARLTVTDSFGLNDTDQVTITVSSSSGGSSGGDGGGSGSSGGCSTNLRILTGPTPVVARQDCIISFTYDNVRYETKLIEVTPSNLTLTLLGNQANTLLDRQARLPLTSSKDLVFSYDKLDYGKVTMTFDIGEKQTTAVATPKKPSQTKPVGEIETPVQETGESVPKESSTPTGAAITLDIKKNLVGFGVMVGIILVGYIIYYVFGKKNY